ncbi:ETEC_3214 domain-containing protein [Streptomyces sp. NPDC102476]|uniref:ETEC_3214 domain-containing protein n=1 Tax=Streptomyces sp. NPDC102476 TaxID=3366181 RepID=UPI003800666D
MRCYRQLAPGIRSEFVERLFGPPILENQHEEQPTADSQYGPAEDREPYSLVERIWTLGEDGYLLTVNRNEQVQAYSLTTCRRRFRPAIDVGFLWGGTGAVYRVRLGVTKFIALGDASTASEIVGWCGSRRFGYYETHTTPPQVTNGTEVTWACGMSMVGLWRSEDVPAQLTHHRVQTGRCEREDFDSPEMAEFMERVGSYRRHARINSIMIGRPGRYASSIGPADDARVVMLRATSSAWSRARLRRKTRKSIRS